MTKPHPHSVLYEGLLVELNEDTRQVIDEALEGYRIRLQNALDRKEAESLETDAGWRERIRIIDEVHAELKIRTFAMLPDKQE